MKIEWIDSGRFPQNKPNAAYPDGMDLDLSAGAAASCKVGLPYPAKRCGVYLVECETCGQRIAITTAGRSDDPRSATIPCKLVKPAN